MHPMQPYINLYVFSYISVCIYASMHLSIYASYVYKLVCIFYISLCIYVINKYIMFHGIYEYMTLTIYKIYINYAFKKGYYYSYGLILDL